MITPTTSGQKPTPIMEIITKIIIKVGTILITLIKEIKIISSFLK
jgi:hypothetical protein